MDNFGRNRIHRKLLTTKRHSLYKKKKKKISSHNNVLRTYQLVLFRSFPHENIYWCYIIAEGFRFMPLSLVRLRTFRLSTWVS